LININNTFAFPIPSAVVVAAPAYFFFSHVLRFTSTDTPNDIAFGPDVMWRVIKYIYKRTDLIARRLYGHVIYTLDNYSRALSWPLDALHEDHVLEKFVAPMPGFIARPLRSPKEALEHVINHDGFDSPLQAPILGPPLPTRYGSRRASNIHQGAQLQTCLNLRT
jgi:hypothetical protein